MECRFVVLVGYFEDIRSFLRNFDP